MEIEIEQCEVTVCTEVSDHSDPAGASEPNIPQWPLPQTGVLIIFDIYTQIAAICFNG